MVCSIWFVLWLVVLEIIGWFGLKVIWRLRVMSGRGCRGLRLRGVDRGGCDITLYDLVSISFYPTAFKKFFGKCIFSSFVLLLSVTTETNDVNRNGCM